MSYNTNTIDFTFDKDFLDMQIEYVIILLSLCFLLQMCKRWERIVAVNPRAPAGYPNYLIKTKKYLLLKNSSTNASKLAIPLLAAPTQLTQPMKDLFNKQEQERYKLRQQHIIEGVRSLYYSPIDLTLISKVQSADRILTSFCNFCFFSDTHLGIQLYGSCWLELLIIQIFTLSFAAVMWGKIIFEGIIYHCYSFQEKLRIAYEQEIVRVYTKGARASAGQETPLSVCTVLKDKESGTVYHPFNALKVNHLAAVLFLYVFFASIEYIHLLYPRSKLELYKRSLHRCVNHDTKMNCLRR